MQQPVEMLNPPMNITTQQIQEYLDENKQLIMAILENQNLGKSAECASYQTQLQQNLMYLAKIADTQSQPPKMLSQKSQQSAYPQEHYIHPSQAAMTQQHGFLASKSSLSLNDQQLPHVQQQQFIQGQMGMRFGASTSSGMFQAMETGPRSSFMNVQGGEQDSLHLQAGAGGHGKSVSTYNSGDTEA